MARHSSPSKRRASSTNATQTPRATPEQVLQVLESLQSSHHDNITIIKISEPISSALHDHSSSSAQQQRTSDVSNTSLDNNPTPASLEADLCHYRELFAKLRFSYVEQVTKEKFIRAIVGDPPLIVTPQENADLEASNVLAKARLKAFKTEVASTVAELERRGRQLAAKYEQVQLDTATLRDLVDPAGGGGGRMAELEGRIAQLRAEADIDSNSTDGPSSEDSRKLMNLPLAKTAILVEERRAALHDLDRHLEHLERAAPRRQKERERLQTEVNALETKRANVTAAAREAKRRKENNLSQSGGGDDDLETRGRWYRASEAALGEMLGV